MTGKIISKVRSGHSTLKLENSCFHGENMRTRKTIAM